jgi:hypothetical protein
MHVKRSVFTCELYRYRYMEHIVTEDAEFWLYDGEKHRDDDLPAEVHKDGTKMWFFKGLLHRLGDRPAVEWADGSKIWYYRGQIHRVNGPAAMWADGTNVWYLFGKVIPSKLTRRWK